MPLDYHSLIMRPTPSSWGLGLVGFGEYRSMRPTPSSWGLGFVGFVGFVVVVVVEEEDILEGFCRVVIRLMSFFADRRNVFVF